MNLIQASMNRIDPDALDRFFREQFLQELSNNSKSSLQRMEWQEAELSL